MSNFLKRVIKNIYNHNDGCSNKTLIKMIQLAYLDQGFPSNEVLFIEIVEVNIEDMTIKIKYPGPKEEIFSLNIEQLEALALLTLDYP